MCVYFVVDIIAIISLWRGTDIGVSIKYAYNQNNGLIANNNNIKIQTNYY